MGGQSLINIVQHADRGTLAMKLIACLTKGEIK